MMPGAKGRLLLAGTDLMSDCAAHGGHIDIMSATLAGSNCARPA
jgi:hypothetical protein